MESFTTHCPCLMDNRPLILLTHSWLAQQTERHRHFKCSSIPGMVKHKGKMHKLLPLRFTGNLESKTTTLAKPRPLMTPGLRRESTCVQHT